MALAAIAPAVSPSVLVIFLLVFARVSGAIIASPIFSEQAVPSQIKVGLSAIVAGILTPGQMAVGNAPVPSDAPSFAILLGEQLLLGLAFALVFTAVFRAGEGAGELIGQQLGVTLAGWQQPGADGEMHSIGQIYHIVASLIFLGLDGQHWVLLGLGASLQSMPVTRVVLSPELINTLIPLGGAALQFSIGLALPLLVTLLLADLITGLLGRAMPALNMFVIGLPLKIVLGIVGLIIAAPFTVTLLSQYLQYLPKLPLWH
jgi:flagellar biosynthetic protein FliR